MNVSPGVLWFPSELDLDYFWEINPPGGVQNDPGAWSFADVEDLKLRRMQVLCVFIFIFFQWRSFGEECAIMCGRRTDGHHLKIHGYLIWGPKGLDATPLAIDMTYPLHNDPQSWKQAPQLCDTTSTFSSTTTSSSMGAKWSTGQVKIVILPQGPMAI
jgi:hypothetical protein